MPNSNPAPAAMTLDDVRSVSPAFAKYTEALVVNDLWKRPALSARERSIVTVAALIMRNQTIGLLPYVNKALDAGVTPGEISELITHVAFYAGWPHAFAAVAIVKDIFAQRGIGADQLPPVSLELLPVAQALPDETVLAAVVEGLRPNFPGLMDYTEEVLIREVWRRPGLVPRDRALATISALIAGGLTGPLAFYLNRAVLMGITQAQVSEVVTHLAFYAGWPVVFSAIPAIQGVFSAPAA